MIRRLLAIVLLVTLAAPPAAHADGTYGVTDRVLDTAYDAFSIVPLTAAIARDTAAKGTIQVTKTVTGQPAVVRLPGGEGDYPTQWSCDLSNVMNIRCAPARTAPRGSWICAPGGPWVTVDLEGVPGSYVQGTADCGSGEAASCIAATAGVAGACSDTAGEQLLETFSCPITQHVGALSWTVTCHTYDP